MVCNPPHSPAAVRGDLDNFIVERLRDAAAIRFVPGGQRPEIVSPLHAEMVLYAAVAPAIGHAGQQVGDRRPRRAECRQRRLGVDVFPAVSSANTR